MKLKYSLKRGIGKADLTSMIEGLDLFKANSDKPFFIQVVYDTSQLSGYGDTIPRFSNTKTKKSDHPMALKNGGQVRIGPTRKQ